VHEADENEHEDEDENVNESDWDEAGQEYSDLIPQIQIEYHYEG
jgi:hypothetical protein